MARVIAVAFVGWNRPDYLKQTLEAWSRVRGIGNSTLVFHIEPGCEEVVELCRSVDFAETRVVVNHSQLGHAWNVYQSMEHAFSYTDYAIQAVDDYLPSTDLLELHSWHRAGYADDPHVIAMTSGRDVAAPSGGLAGVWRCQLIGILSGFHKHKWGLLADHWEDGLANWWAWVDDEWLQGAPGYEVLFPAIGRAYALDEPGANACFAPDPPPQAYYEMRGKRERAFGFARFWEEY